MAVSVTTTIVVTLLLIVCISLVNVDASTINPITSLPTYDKAIKGQYSGYITVDSTKQYFYWFIESEANSKDPSQDPFIIYFQGGPACSSMLGALTENGYFTVMKDIKKSGQDKFYIVENKYSWSKLGHVLYIESPAGVGFSYNEDGNYTTGDTQTAEDNLAVVKDYASSPLFVGGESYAGHYIPQVAQLMVQDSSINIHGIMAGNPSFNYTTDAQYYLPFMAGHGLLSYSDFQNLTDICQGSFYPGTAECNDAINILSTNFDLINPYNILEACKGGGPSKGGACFTADAFSSELRQSNPETTVAKKDVSQVFIPCLDESAVTGYLQRSDVMKHLGVSVRNIATGTWQPCSSAVNYTQYLENIPQDYQTLLQAGLHVLVYSGDLDSCVPYLGTSLCVEQLGYPILNKWQPWTFKDEEGFEQVAGYQISYDSSSAHPKSTLTYATVKGAGHMVPQYKPKESLLLVTQFISNSLGMDSQ
ncbi:hypothetical protein DFA_09151 [Cavenderia fasciculata]|uniref:Carboxypeptidase n=1 Tax=Cavenderia fasciculata TaxID=261658 RepID=F4Q6U4_CACFS|nr:uncharacterized protein DFA_09151 [Cavenderia fasciculata]EGG16126.1 hypothetical protein DFA_09151 [Cavenderia fasciculata]|eukprot:XP_004352579.1 hypothetical protein DFA_09151 [Cavenderia fasciculata]